MVSFTEVAYVFPTTWCFMLGILGLVMGSFLNVVICRLPQILMARWHDEACLTLNLPQPSRPIWNLCWPRSACGSCHRPLLRRDLLPLLSWCLLRGKSRCCQRPISTVYPLVELSCGVLFFIAARIWPPGLPLVASLFFICLLLPLAIIDAQTLLLPDILTLPLIWLGLLVNIDACYVPLSDAVYGAVAGYLSLTLLSVTFKYLTGKEALGGGDAKLLAAFGAWFGWSVLPSLLTMAACSGLLITVIVRLSRRQALNQPMAFGPWLILAGGPFLFL